MEKHVLFISDRATPFDFSCLGRGWRVTTLPLARRRGGFRDRFSHVLLDANLTRSSRAEIAKDLLWRIEHPGRILISCDQNSVHSQRQAWSLGADAIVSQPLNHRAVRQAILGPVESPPGSGAACQLAASELANLFSCVEDGVQLQGQDLLESTSQLGCSIREFGIGNWLDSVADHHEGTYQHCLIVAGLGASFARELGFSQRDEVRMTTAALVHDVGKIRVSADILEKPTKLTDAEFCAMKQHTIYGAEYICKNSDLGAEIIDATLHHHELLDGSGYPDGLVSSQIPDLTRMITICDIFGALIERRSYKGAMQPRAAFDVLREMASAGKLEPALVSAFSAVASRIVEESWSPIGLAREG